jgi:hypothetical protein
MDAGKFSLAALFFVIVIVGAVYAQAPDTLWTRHYGGSGFEEGNSVVETPDGGFIIAGFSESYGAGLYNLYLVKVNDMGDTLWTRTYDGNDRAFAQSICSVESGGFAVVGSNGTFNIGDIYFLRIDDYGDTLWTRTYSYEFSQYSSAIIQTDDGGFLIVGSVYYDSSSNGDVYLVKTDNVGDTLWTRVYGGDSYDSASDVEQTNDGGYIVAGTTDSYGAAPCNGYVLRLNSDGDTLWTRIYGDSCLNSFSSVEITEDGGYVFAGWIRPLGTYEGNYYLVRTSCTGDTIWTKQYGGNYLDMAYDVAVTADGGYIMVGYGWHYSTVGRSDCYIVRTNDVGDTLWTCGYGNDGVHADHGSDIEVTSDEGYIIVGELGIDHWDFDVYVIRIAPDVAIVEPTAKMNNNPWAYELSEPYPNPFNAVVNVEYDVGGDGKVNVSVYNVLGERVGTVVEHYASPGSYSVRWDAGELPSGIYFVRMDAGEFRQTRKVVLLK